MVAGVDGAVYTPAVLPGPAGASVPAVVAATHAGTVEVITGFSGDAARGEWLADRGRIASVPGITTRRWAHAVPVRGPVSRSRRRCWPGC